MSAINSVAIKAALVQFGITERKVERATKALEAAQAEHAANVTLVQNLFAPAVATEAAATTEDGISVKIGSGDKE